MGYYIYAWLEKGKPQLQIIDAKSNSVCLSWSYQLSINEKNGDKKAIQRLFRQLLLLTCKQELSNYRVFEMRPITNKQTSLLPENIASGSQSEFLPY